MSKKVLLLIIKLISISSFLALGQDLEIADSLKRHINDPMSIEQRIALYLDISQKELPDEALRFAQMALELAKENNLQLLIAESYEELSLIERNFGNIPLAFNYSFEALTIYQALERQDLIAGMNEQIGTHYSFDKNFQKAEKYLSLALKNYENLKDTQDIIMVSINLGETYRMDGKLDSAEYFFEKCLLLEKTNRDELIYAYALGNLGLVHSAKHLNGSAKDELSEATEILERLGDSYAASYYKSEIGKIYIEEENYKNGEALLKESLSVAEKDGLKEQIRDISKILSEYYELIGQPIPALSFRKQYENYNDSLLNIDNVRRIESLRADYEIDQKQKEVLLLNRINKNQKTIAYLLGLGSLVFIGFSFMLYRSNQKMNKANDILKEQKEVISTREEEKALLLKELNHRVKNNLQMIASLLNLQSSQVQDKEAAQALEAGKLRVEALSLIHQKLYSKDHHTTIAIKDYLDELVRNLVHVYNTDIQPIIDIDDIDLNIDRAIPLGLIVNELVINALKYAYKDVSQPILHVSFKSKEDLKVLTVADNGTGLMNVSSQNEDSFGLRLTKSLSDQIDGNLIFINEQGCKWQLTLK